MAKISKEELKNKFKGGNIISQQDFQDLIDSCYELTPVEFQQIFVNFLNDYLYSAPTVTYNSSYFKTIVDVIGIPQTFHVQGILDILTSLTKNLSSYVSTFGAPIVYNIELDGTVVEIDSSKPYYIKVDENVSYFSILIDSISGVDFNNYYNVNSFIDCKLTYTTTSNIFSENNEVFVTNSVNFSAINDKLFTFYYFTTGSSILGITRQGNYLRPPEMYMFENVIPLTSSVLPIKPYNYYNNNIPAGIGVSLLNVFL